MTLGYDPSDDHDRPIRVALVFCAPAAHDRRCSGVRTRRLAIKPECCVGISGTETLRYDPWLVSVVSMVSWDEYEWWLASFF